ncbi:MAG: hypothetical protein COA78_07750 [Blastopirellula sp.]|nr:MAG: hypothetical protein COA78_07750 [Blastopirellula sp.]
MSEISQQNQKLLVAQENGLLNDEVGRAVETCFRYGCAGAFENEYLDKITSSHAISMARCPFANPKGLNQGDFTLGYTLDTKEEIRIPHQWMGSPSLIVGSTGSGKTNTAKYWSEQLGKICEGTLLIDCVKSEMGSLAPSFENGKESQVSVLDTQQLKLNPLMIPDHVSPHAYAGNVADSLVRVLEAPPVARKVIRQSIHGLFDRHNLFSGKISNYPTLFDLRHFIQNAKQFNSQSRDALLTALDPILISLRGVLSYQQGWNIQSLAKQKIILGLNSCSQADKNLIIETFLFSLFSSRIAQQVSNVDPNILVYLDESSSLLESDDSAISNWIGLIRGVGIALILSNQSAVSISQKILSNIPNLFIGQCSSFADLNVMGSAVGLDAQQKRYLANHLQPGCFLGRLGRGKWRKPFLFTTTLMDSGNSSNQPRFQISDQLADLPVIVSEKDQSFQPEWAKQVISEQESSLLLLEEVKKYPSNEQDPIQGIPEEIVDSRPLDVFDCGLEPDEFRLLSAVAENPFKPVSFFPSELCMSKSRLIKLRKSLLNKQLIIQQEMQTLGRGRPSRLLVLTESGQVIVNKLSPAEQ